MAFAAGSAVITNFERRKNMDQNSDSKNMPAESAREWRIEFGPIRPGPGPGDGSDSSIHSEIFKGAREEAEKRAQALCDEYSKNYYVPKEIQDTIDAVQRARGEFCSIGNWLGTSHAGKLIWSWVERFDQILKDIKDLPILLRACADQEGEYSLYNTDIGHFKVGYSIREHESPKAKEPEEKKIHGDSNCEPCPKCGSRNVSASNIRDVAPSVIYISDQADFHCWDCNHLWSGQYGYKGIA